MQDAFEVAIQLREQGLSADSESAGRAFLEKALVLFQQAVKDKPQDGDRVFYLAMSHDILDQESEAIPLYERALALGLPLSQRFEATLYLASSYFNVGNLAQAQAYLVKAERLLTIEGAPDEYGAFSAIARKIRAR